MDLTSIVSDDQLAILGCFGALLVCGLIAAISFHFGPAGKKSTNTLRSRDGRSILVQANATNIAAATSENTGEQRRAA